MKKTFRFICLILICFQLPFLYAVEKKKANAAKEKEYIQAYRQKIREFVKQLSDADPRIRQKAALNLIDMKMKDLVAEEIAPLVLNKNALVREKAAYVLGELGAASENNIPLLLKAAQDKDETVARSAIAAIGKIKKGYALPDEIEKRRNRIIAQHVHELIGKNLLKKEQAVVMLSRYSGYGQQVFGEILPLYTKGRIEKRHFLQILSNLGPVSGAEPSIFAILEKSRSRKILGYALDAALSAGVRDIPVEKLKKDYKKFPRLAERITRVFAAVRSRESVIALADLVLHTADDTAAIRTCEQLKQTGKDGFPAVPLLVNAYKDATYIRKKMILSALGAFGKCTPQGIRMLSEAAIKSLHKKIREESAYALRDIQRIDKDVFRSALNHSDPVMRLSALSAGAVIGKPMEDVLDSVLKRLNDINIEVQKKAALVLATIGEAASPALDTLFQILKNEAASDAQAGAAGYAIAKIAGRKAIPRLQELYEVTDPKKHYLCRRVIHVIKNIGAEAKETIPMLTETLSYSYKRRYEKIFLMSLVTLGEMGQDAESALPALKKLTNSRYRRSVEEVINKIRGISREKVDE